jgi:hypothetical protein
MKSSEQKAKELQEAISIGDTDQIDSILTRLSSSLVDEFREDIIALSLRKALNKAMLNMDTSKMEDIEQQSRLTITKLN